MIASSDCNKIGIMLLEFFLGKISFLMFFLFSRNSFLTNLEYLFLLIAAIFLFPCICNSLFVFICILQVFTSTLIFLFTRLIMLPFQGRIQGVLAYTTVITRKLWNRKSTQIMTVNSPMTCNNIK